MEEIEDLVVEFINEEEEMVGVFRERRRRLEWKWELEMEIF